MLSVPIYLQYSVHIWQNFKEWKYDAFDFKHLTLFFSGEREHVQKKTFTKWVNSHLARINCRITDLYTDLRDGKYLIKLLEILSGERLPRPTKVFFHHVNWIWYKHFRLKYDCTDHKNEFDFFIRLVTWPKIAVKKCQNLIFKVNFKRQKSSESF